MVATRMTRDRGRDRDKDAEPRYSNSNSNSSARTPTSTATAAREPTHANANAKTDTNTNSNSNGAADTETQDSNAREEGAAGSGGKEEGEGGETRKPKPRVRIRLRVNRGYGDEDGGRGIGKGGEGKKGEEDKEEEKMPGGRGKSRRGSNSTAAAAAASASAGGGVVKSKSKSKGMGKGKGKGKGDVDVDVEMSGKGNEKGGAGEDPERNIDNVVFASLSFRAWYPSWYPKEVIGEKVLGVENGSGGAGKGGIVVKELWVCGRCFAYCRDVEGYVGHVRVCGRERGAQLPGRRVYVHGGGGSAGEDQGNRGRWEVWEVDGGVETVFCQNLSLFAKLFLDNKSVFFDVSGFNYFLLVHQPPPSPTPTTPPPTPQIVGFFSKEKMSWDNNNLACILIFPPWQRKGLGSILMGVSYEISRREEILGGPEKPISDLGKRGYRRYWGAEIARWLLLCRETDRKKGRGMVDVERVSRETWIAGEDCLGVLRDMGVVERAGKGKGMVERVRVDKVRVREWVEREGLGLQRVVDPQGFVEGYGYRDSGSLGAGEMGE